MDNADPCSDLKPTDELLKWWKKMEPDICCKADMTKKYRNIAKRIEDFRSKMCNLMTVRRYLEQIINSIDELNQMNHSLVQDLGSTYDDFCKRWADNSRKMDRLTSGAGFAIQALVTKWFYEAGFQIADIEVEHEDNDGKHSFDIEIKDESGTTYDVEVWQGTGPLAYEEQRAETRALHKGNRMLCKDDGEWDERMKYVSEYGGIGDDADANFRTLIKKMDQMRKNHTGIVVACIRRELKPDLTLIPKEWGPRLPENRCVIALRIGDGGYTEERRGTGYLVCSPKFAHTEAVKAMIESLKFEYVKYPTVWKYQWWKGQGDLSSDP